jgi:hypothetical protein
MEINEIINNSSSKSYTMVISSPQPYWYGESEKLKL